MKLAQLLVPCGLALAISSCTQSLPTEAAMTEPMVEAPKKEVIKPIVKPTPKAVKSPQMEAQKGIQKGDVTEVLVEQVFELRSKGQLLLIDTRPPIFFGLGHITGAVNVPLKQYPKSFDTKRAQIDSAVAAGKVIVIYCANDTCVDSHSMAKKLAAKGYDVSIFKGGWQLWKQTGLE